MIEYQFVMHHRGNLPSQRCLESTAKDFNGKIIFYSWHYTGNIVQSALDQFEPLFDPIEHTGRKVSVRFSSEETLESFLAKLTRIGVDLRGERATKAV